MKITTVLFDLDGTLLPMDQDVFTEEYLKKLVNCLSKHGYDPNLLIKTIWKRLYLIYWKMKPVLKV